MKVVLTVDCRLLEALRTAVPGASNRTLRQMLEQGRVSVNGQVCRKSGQEVRTGDVLEIGQKQLAVRERSDLEIVWEDHDIIVVNKPAGLLSVATPGEKENTVHACLRKHLRIRDPGQKIFVVHRLDKYASGLLVFARSESMQQKLKNLFEKHAIDRRYWAIVEGRIENESGTVRSRLVEERNFRVHSTAARGEGKPAVTHYRVLRRLPDLTVLEITLETGRKNQIRVHMSESGHPIAGDRAYGSKVNPLGRLALHAWCLGFMHPAKGTVCRFETPPPPEFRPYIETREQKPSRIPGASRR